MGKTGPTPAECIARVTTRVLSSTGKANIAEVTEKELNDLDLRGAGARAARRKLTEPFRKARAIKVMQDEFDDFYAQWIKNGKPVADIKTIYDYIRKVGVSTEEGS